MGRNALIVTAAALAAGALLWSALAEASCPAWWSTCSIYSITTEVPATPTPGGCTIPAELPCALGG